MFRQLRFALDYLFRRRRMEDELDEEIRTSFEMLVDNLVAHGMTREEARRTARIEFEGMEQVKESVRDSMAGSSVHGFLQDFVYAWRGLGRVPSFAVISVLTLALGIGVNAAIFSVFYGVLLRPLPYDRPEQLALVWASFRTAGHARAPVSGAILGEIERRNRSLASVAGIWTVTRTFTGEDPEQVKCARVTSNFFDVLGVRAEHGRTFAKEDSGGPAVVLTGGLFQRRFAGNENLVGKAVPMDRANTIVGVLPADFQLHFAPDSNIPADVQVFDTFEHDIYRDRAQYYIRVVGRLRPGVSVGEAQRDLDRVAKEIGAAYTEYATEDLHFTVASMQADAVRDLRPALTALFAGSLFILLICCVNVASLLMARASDRQREIALRIALGASRGRILRQWFAEGGVLCGLGAAAGLAVGWACFRALLSIRPERLANAGEVRFNWPVLAFATGITLVAASVFGVVPAMESLRLDLIAALRSRGPGWLSRLQRRAGGALVVTEITLAFVLVTGAALTARTLANTERVRPGFEPQNLLAFQVSGAFRGRRAVQEWEAQLATLPGVEAVGATSHLPLDTDIPNWYSPFQPEGVTANEAKTLVSDLRCVTPGYLPAMGARLIAGRYFEQQDRAGGRMVVIVDDLLARTTWPGQSAIGKKLIAEHVTDRGFEPVPSVVVGVVEHLHNHSLTRKVRGQIYLPFEQSRRSPLTFVVRARVEPLSLVPAIRKALRDLNKNAAMAKVRPMTAYVARDISPLRFTAILAGLFGALAFLLAVLGVYGVFDYQVSRRRAEMGIRMALGAHAQAVLRLVLREGAGLAAVGVLLGALIAFAAAGLLRTLLYGVTPLDPLSYGLALVLLPAAALLGCLHPAWRAAAASPAEVIREE